MPEETLEPNSYTRLANTSWFLNTGSEYFNNSPAMRTAHRRARIDCNSRPCLPLTVWKTDLSSLQATAINDVNEINLCGPGPHKLISLTSALGSTSEEALEPDSYTRLPNTSWLLNTGNEFFRNVPAMRTAHRLV